MGEVTAGGQFPFVTGMTAQNAIAIAGWLHAACQPLEHRGHPQVNGQLYRADVPLTHPLAPGDTVVVRDAGSDRLGRAAVDPST